MNNEITKVTITIFRNSYKIHPYRKSGWNKKERCKVGTCPKLDESFYIFQQFGGRWNVKDSLELYDKKSKTLNLPGGVDLKFIQAKLYENNVLFDIIDKSKDFINTRSESIKMNENYTIRSSFEAEGIDFLTSDFLFHSKMLALATGTGKTFCAVSAAFRLKLPILVISQTLIDQWVEKIEDYTDCTVKNGGIKVVTGVDNLHSMLTKKWSNVKSVFYLSTSTTLSKYVEKYGSLNDVFDRLGVGIKCFDEFHMNWFQNVRIDMNLNTKHTWYLTATPQRTNRSESKVFARTMSRVPMYGTKSRDANDHYNLRLVNYNTFPNEYEIQSCMTYKGLSGIMYWNYIFSSYERKMYIIGMIKMLLDPIIKNDPDAKVLIYLAKIEHIETIIEILDKMYKDEDTRLKIGNYTTGVGNRKKIEIRKNIVFTTIGSGGTGLDKEDVVASFVLVPFSSPITASQMIGRLRKIEDKEVYYYDFIDEGFKTMRNQREKRLSVFRDNCKTINSKSIYESDIKTYLNI